MMHAKMSSPSRMSIEKISPKMNILVTSRLAEGILGRNQTTAVIAGEISQVSEQISTVEAFRRDHVWEA